MRTSKISRETTRIFNALSPNSQRRSTRSVGKGLATFALGYDGAADEVKAEEHGATIESTPSAALSDIEDIASPSQLSRKRKRGSTAPSPAKMKATIITATEDEVKWTSPRRRVKKEESDESDPSQGPGSPRQKAKPKIPAKRVQASDGAYHYTSPANWEELYNIVRAQRRRNPTAPVDTMGCEDLFWQNAPPREKRYHTLTALMLSSQTKDTVNAAAMQRLHTELVPQDSPVTSSSLTVENILACDPKHLDSLIGKVGFHNNKTKYIKAAAQILRDEYASDIPNTIEGLTRLPGVGPKMAYLCMSAAWGIDEGIGVDVHVHRITNLWGWHKTKSPEETRMWLEGWLPKEKWHEINKLLVGLGQTVCLPIGRRCGKCDVAGTGLCKAEIRGWKATERRVKKTTEIDAGGALKSEAKEHVEVEFKEELAEQG